MTWSVMSDVPNPLFDVNGNPYSGAVLKAYLPGTTTSTSIAIDSAGGSPQTSITYNAEGKLEVSGNEILPYIDRKHKWGIFANATDATANTPFYMGPFDNVDQLSDTSSASILYNQGDTGSLERTVQNRLRETRSVKDFGATGDYATSGTSDAAAIQAAFDALVNPAWFNAPIGAVRFPEGQYFIDSTVTITSGSGTISVICDDPESTVFIIDDNIIGFDISAGKFTLSNCKIVSKATWDATVANSGSTSFVRDTSGVGMQINGGRPELRGLTIYGFGDSGIKVPASYGLTNAFLDDLRITACGVGINLLSSATVSTTTEIKNCYLTSCDTGYNLLKFDHCVFYNNIAELCTVGLVAVSSFSTVWQKMYFEKNVTTDYSFTNVFPVIVGTISTVSAATPATSENIYNASVSSSDMSSVFIEQDQLSSTHLGMLSYDDAPNATKGLVYNRFKMTGPGTRFYGLRVLNRNTASGGLNAIGTFAMVNGAKAAHTSILQVKADGTVLDSDEFITSVTKLATGEYSLNLAASAHPDHVSVSAYQIYATGATPVRNAAWSMTSANLTTHETGRAGLIQTIYITITDSAGALQDSGFTAAIMWNRSDDLTS